MDGAVGAAGVAADSVGVSVASSGMPVALALAALDRFRRCSGISVNLGSEGDRSGPVVAVGPSDEGRPVWDTGRLAGTEGPRTQNRSGSKGC